MASTRARTGFTLALLIPWLLTFGVFWLYPFCYALVLSFSNVNTLAQTIEPVGFANYAAVFHDTLFWKSLANTAVFTFGTVPVTASLALMLAIMLHSKMVKFPSFFRAAYFMPSVTSLVVISLIFINLYARDGYVNALLGFCGLPQSQRGFLLEPSTALAAVMGMDVWISAGYYMMLFLAGLEAIPRDLYESAMLSGASGWQRFRRITLPLLRPTLAFVVVINTIKSFQVFIEIYVMTKGGPLDSTSTLVYMIFKSALDQTDKMGYASALSFVIMAMLIGFSVVQLRLLRSLD